VRGIRKRQDVKLICIAKGTAEQVASAVNTVDCIHHPTICSLDIDRGVNMPHPQLKTRDVRSEVFMAPTFQTNIRPPSSGYIIFEVFVDGKIHIVDITCSDIWLPTLRRTSCFYAEDGDDMFLRNVGKHLRSQYTDTMLACGLLNDLFSVCKSVLSTGRMTNELERIWKEGGRGLIEYLFQHRPEGLRRTMKHVQSE
jgi:hypothetical protein